MASSSARRAARVAARSGAKSPNKQRNWLFPASIAVIAVIGLGVVFYAKSTNEAATSNDTPPRAQLAAGEPADHWHAAFAVDICGEEQEPVTDARAEDPLGIHTHGDGLIHIHPFATRSSGEGATMSRFFEQTGLQVTDDGIKMPDGKVYKEGETECDGKPGQVQMAVWDKAVKAPTSEPDEIVTSNFGDVRFTQDYMAFTLAFVPDGADITAPSTSTELKTLGECDGENPPPECNTAAATPSTLPTDTGTGASTPAPSTTAATPTTGGTGK